MSETISIRVPKELKERMKRYNNVNWSEYLRGKIEEKLVLEGLKELSKKIEEAKRRIPPSPTPDFSTKAIREDRERR